MNKITFIKKFNFLIKSLNHSYDFWVRWNWFDDERKLLFETIKKIWWIRLKKKDEIIKTLYNFENLLINTKNTKKNTKVEKIKVINEQKWTTKTYETIEIKSKNWNDVVKLHLPKITKNLVKIISEELEEVKENKMKKLKWINRASSKQNFNDNKNTEKIIESYSEYEKSWDEVYINN